MSSFINVNQGTTEKEGVGGKNLVTLAISYIHEILTLLILKIELLLCFHETTLTARHTYDDLQPGVVEKVLFHHLLQREHLSVHDVRQPADAAGHPLPQERASSPRHQLVFSDLFFPLTANLGL